jgi:hypothetical protein
VHGYKVSMRDQMSSPEFVYLSVLINSEIQNRLETWATDLERLHDSNQLISEGSPRDQLLRRFREQQEAVDDIFGGKQRAPAQAKQPIDPPKTPIKKAKPKREEKRRSRLEWNRQLVLLVTSTVLILASGGYIAWQTGVVGGEEVRALEPAELERLSSVLGPGWIKGSGAHRRFEGSIVRRRWLPLDSRRRMDQAVQMAKVLAGLGIKNARVTMTGGIAIEIRDGLVSYVEGGKL